MKSFVFSQKKQLSKNVFAFIRNKKAILFNRMSFERKHVNWNKNSVSNLDETVRDMEKRTPKIAFRPPTLKKIRVEVNLACNCACDYCLVYQNEIKKVNTSMSKNTAKKIISFYKKNIKNGSLMIVGGEPFLSWETVRLFIRKIKDPIKIFTNGTIITRDIIETLKRNKNITLIISLDGRRRGNKKRKFKNGKEIYSIVMKNLKTFQKNGCNVGIACLCCDENVKYLFKTVKFFIKDLNIKYLGLSFPHYIKNSSLDLDIQKYAMEMIKIFDFSVRNKVFVEQLAKRFSPLVSKKFRFYSCKLLGEQKTFYPDGKEVFCTKIDSIDFSENNNLAYFQSVIPINNKICKRCSAIGICGGGCFWDGIMRFKYGVDERECSLNNFLLDYFLWSIYSTERSKNSLEEKFNSLIIK